MTNREVLTNALTAAYTDLFSQPRYALAAAKTTPERLAQQMTDGLLTSTASNTGDGVVLACKALGIKPSYKAIRAFVG